MQIEFINSVSPEEGEGYLLNIKDGHEVFLHAFCEGKLYGHERFYYSVLLSPYVRESEWRNVVWSDDLSGSKTIGMIFTASSLAKDSEVGDECDAIKSYASNAVNCLVRSRYGAEILKEIGVFEDSGIDVLSLLGDNISIAIFDKHQLQRFDVSEDNVDLFLFSDGYRPLKTVGSNNHFVEFSKRKRILCLADELVEDKDKILRAFSFANGSYSSSSCFLSLYQVIEVLIDKIFYHEVSKKIVPSIDEMTVWDLKEKLKDISGEKNRVKLIDEKCTPGGAYSEACDGLAQACRDFLQASSVELKGEGWANLLYLVRNQVVHRQYFIIDEELGLDLVCKEFRKFLALAISRFQLSPPSRMDET
ncbi:hypothetical protein [Billgrantia montanilacus]|uniref:hypothetical protein n=1 Tax=Billgrantia montanilacus TaxID=2282305 RepID=UPI0011C01E89|nr:hypothetical protein [Halomonas montanilacus]